MLKFLCAFFFVVFPFYNDHQNVGVSRCGDTCWKSRWRWCRYL